MSEAGRASIVTPVLLRTWLEESFVHTNFIQAIKRVLRGEGLESLCDIPLARIPATNIIVYMYAMMAKTNSILMSRSMMPSERRELKKHLIRSRLLYQCLCEAAATATPSRSRSTSVASSRSPSPRRRTSWSQVSLDTHHSEQLDDNDDAIDENVDLELGYEEGATLSKKGGGYRALKGRPNVHVALHHPDIVKEYATAYNCNVLIFEDKHR